MISVLTTTDRVDVYNGTSWSAIVAPSNGALTSWTPAIVQSGAVTATTQTATYSRVGRTVFARFNMNVTGGAGVAANVVTVSLPVNVATTDVDDILGTGYIWDNSVPNVWPGQWVIASSSTIKLAIGSIGAAALPYAGVTSFTAALAASDIVTGSITYEAAADG